MADKYEPLVRWLSACSSSPVTLSFQELDALVGGLPPSAWRNRTWWGNTLGNSQARAWLTAGWVVDVVDLAAQKVTYRRGDHQPRARSGASRSGTRGRVPILDGVAAFEVVVRQAGWPSLEALVAAHAVFLDPRTVAQTAGRALFPVVRDPNRRGQLGTLPDGRAVLFDDNSTPTDVFLWAADRIKGPDVQFNHVWSRPSDPDAYTALWNLCCTPAFVAKTSDTHRGVVAALRFRSYELYGVVPEGEATPVCPDGYDGLVWAPMPPPVDDLEGLLRARLRSAPSRRAAVAAREIGWLYSDGPDRSIGV